MLQLHYFPGTAAMTPHILLEEIGAPFELVVVDRMANAYKAPAYLKLNPNGLIPVLVDGDLVVYETAAICLYLCDKYPQAQLAPAVGTVQRAHFYKWLAWLTNSLQATLMLGRWTRGFSSAPPGRGLTWDPICSGCWRAPRCSGCSPRSNWRNLGSDASLSQFS